MSGNWGAALGAFVPLVIGMLVVLVAMVVFLIIGIRVMAKDKILATFHKNHKKGGALLKYDSINQCVWLGKEDDPNREKYMVTEDEIEWIEWPGMLPHFFCVTIRSLEYVRGVPTPVHVERKVNTNISAKALRLQSDGNVLQAVYMHARTALGLQKQSKMSMMVMLLLVGTFALSLFGVWKSMQSSTDVTAIKNHMITIEQKLGVGASTESVPQLTPITPTPTSPSNIPGLGGK